MKTPPERIRFPLVGWDRSGGVRIIVQIANYLATQGWQVQIIVPAYSLENDAYRLDERVELIGIQVGRIYPIAVLRFLLWVILNACKDTDICVATYYLTAYPIFFSWLLHGRRSQIVYVIQHYEPISRIQSSQRLGLLKPALFILARSTYRLPYHRVAVSSWIRDQIGDQATTVIPNGVDLSIFAPGKASDKREPLMVGAIARTTPLKGYHTLVSLFAELQNTEDVRLSVLVNHPDVVFPVDGVEYFVGDNDAAVLDFYRACDIFVFTSVLEGFGLPPLEAMACGVPVITTDCGGIREYASTDNALIVPPKDSEALLKAVMELGGSHEWQSRLRLSSLRTSKAFSLEEMKQRYEEYFYALLD